MPDPTKWPVVAWFDSGGKIFGGLGALVGLISGVVLLLHQCAPSPTPPRSATLDVDSVRKSTLRYYLIDSGQREKVEQYKAAALAQLGNYYYLSVTVHGLQGRESEIVWSLDRRDKGTPVEDLDDAADWIHQLLQTVTPPANSFSFVAKVWIQRPPFPGSFSAILEIDYPEDQSLGVTQTPPFVGESLPPKTSTTFVTKTTATTIPATTTSVTTVVTVTTPTTTETTTSTGATTTTTTTTTAGTTSTFTTTTTHTIPATTTTRVQTVTVVSTAPGETQPTVRPPAPIETKKK